MNFSGPCKKDKTKGDDAYGEKKLIPALMVP
jgi:hypothetical protein